MCSQLLPKKEASRFEPFKALAKAFNGRRGRLMPLIRERMIFMIILHRPFAIAQNHKRRTAHVRPITKRPALLRFVVFGFDQTATKNLSKWGCSNLEGAPVTGVSCRWTSVCILVRQGRTENSYDRNDLRTLVGGFERFLRRIMTFRRQWGGGFMTIITDTV